MTDRINRRTFIKTTAATGASVALLPQLTLFGAGDPDGSGAKSRVVEAHAPGVMIEGRKPDNSRVREMVEKGILDLTGKNDLAAAWRCFVNPDDVVGLKVNSAGGRVMVTHRAILDTVISGVRMAGVPNDRIFLWDQVEQYLTKYYLKATRIDPEKLGIQITGCTPRIGKEHYVKGKPLPGYETEPVKFDWGKVKVAELVANKLTAIINLPILKDHSCAGVTLALKNISHAVVDTPWKCHGDCCNPHIADIVNIPSVRSKLRLHILDGLLGMADGGPPFRGWNHLFVNEKILLSTDPVAIDTLGTRWIVAARKEKGYPPLEKAKNAIKGIEGRIPKHIATAAARGLGTNDPEKMDIRRVEIPAPEEKPGAKKENLKK